ncbi:MAG TPA: hypothetical protein EYM84_09775 [Flavobacteriales bacterium]|nr:hypothetical protein [Flavobacteriales bacterium]HIA11233.1 hypothetical protein [Flavobacteriales bacterium]HIN40548.1 hypothetical protein [Flavobacteriales bacterium]
MISRTSTFILLITLIFTATSCGKYEDGPSFSLKSKKARITNKWKPVKVYFNGDEQPILDDGDSFIEISKNSDYRYFYQNRYLTWDYSGEWKFYDSKKKIIVTLDASIDTLTILRLTKDEFWVSNSLTGGVWETHYEAY